MKRSLALVSMLSLVTSTVIIASDALVLPEKVARVFFVTTAVKATQEFDDGGKKVPVYNEKVTGIKDIAVAYGATGATASIKAEIKREDVAAEYGVTDKFSLSVQVPIILSAKIRVSKNQAAQNFINTNANAGPGTLQALVVKSAGRDGKKAGTLGDILVGGKYQWLNSDEFRAAVGGGVKLPTGSIADADTADYSTTTTCQTRSLIAGVRTYWDYQPAKWYTLNFYSEQEYRFEGDKSETNIDLTNGRYSLVTTKFRPGVLSKAELDSSFSPRFGEHTVLNPGLKLQWSYTTQGHYTDGKGVRGLENLPRSSDFYVSPYASVFYTGMKMPLKLQYTYYHPVSGRNSEAVSGASYELQGYYKF